MSIKYLPSQELMNAKVVAEFLNRPLLLSGEPGTGKTKFAEHISQEDTKNLYVFNTKSTSQSRDLFYTYDAIGHFADKEKNALEFINLEALGRAIVNAAGKEKIIRMLLEDSTSNYQLLQLRKLDYRNEIIDHFLREIDGNKSVVLIDEVDKAPRDFPNDILNEIEYLEFDIRELNLKITLDDQQKATRDKIFVLLTSNFEKNLPEAFLRRCIYHHIEFVEDVNWLKQIVKLHIQDLDENHLSERINDFILLRTQNGIQKKPATSELIDCIKWLKQSEALGSDIRTNKAALSTLLKKNEDLRLIGSVKFI